MTGPFHLFVSFIDKLLHHHGQKGRSSSSGKSDFTFDFEPGDLDAGLTCSTDQTPLLGKYTLARLEELVETCGLAGKLRAKGLGDYWIDVDTSDSFVHKFFLYMGQKGGPKDAQHLLIELVFRRVRALEGLRSTYTYAMLDDLPESPAHSAEQASKQLASLQFADSASTSNTAPPVLTSPTALSSCWNSSAPSAGAASASSSSNTLSPLLRLGTPVLRDLLKLHEPDFNIIEWARMQDPTQPLPVSACGLNLLPGQDYKSLGVGKLVHDTITQLATASQRDALVDCPLYWHNAFFYSALGYMYVNPVFQGICNTLMADLAPAVQEHGVSWVAHAINMGGLRARVPVDSAPPTARTAAAATSLPPVSASTHDADAVGTSTGAPTDADGGAEMVSVVVRWKGQDQMYPISKALHSYFDNPKYKRLVAEFTSHGVFWLEPVGGLLTEDEWAAGLEVGAVDTRPCRGCQQQQQN